MILSGSSHSLLILAMASIAIPVSTALCAPVTDATLHTELQRIASKRIYFAHQSVGDNLIDGVQQIAAVENYPLNIHEYSAANIVPGQTLGHTRIGENGNPLGKLEAFTMALGPTASGVNIALFKFCYDDFTPDTNAGVLFSKYKITMDEIKSHHPSTTFVHITVPLTVVQSGIKATVKRWLGKAPYGLIENKRREEYNALLRMNYQGRELVFDLAEIESTAQSGTRTRVEWKGDFIPALNPTYTDDGSHLNANGRMHAAKALIRLLANSN